MTSLALLVGQGSLALIGVVLLPFRRARRRSDLRGLVEVVNGKVRSRVNLSGGRTEADACAAAASDEAVQQHERGETARAVQAVSCCARTR